MEISVQTFSIVIHDSDNNNNNKDTQKKSLNKLNIVHLYCTS